MACGATLLAACLLDKIVVNPASRLLYTTSHSPIGRTSWPANYATIATRQLNEILVNLACELRC